MGDLIGTAVEGELVYLAPAEFQRIISAYLAPQCKAAIVADMCRLNALYMIARAGSGHIGSSFSSMDILSWLMLEELQLANDPADPENDIFFSSKGHDAPAYYSLLLATGRLPFDFIHQLRRLGGLPGHPDVRTPWIHANTGSLGMGISKAKGMLAAKKRGRAFVLTGDGEWQEGQGWESLISAANYGIDRLIVIVDHNKLQSDTFVSHVSDLGDLPAKFIAFGCHTQRIDGHDFSALEHALNACKEVKGQPHVIIADTIKGRGVSFMEHTSLDNDTDLYRFHSGAPDKAAYSEAVRELMTRLNAGLNAAGLNPLRLETVARPAAPVQVEAPQSLIPAYSRALVEAGTKHENLIALDADLVRDTGLIAFRERFPKRFVECGIAEQDMVSQAGGMALKGLLPVVHSFACFLSARPNEQIYNNATEDTHIVYVGSLAGVIPGGPGHSHQAVRDIAALKGIPGLVMLEPACEREVPLALNYCLEQHNRAAYLRLCSVPWPVSFSLPKDYTLKKGQGVALTAGRDAAIIAYGPIMLSNAMRAAQTLRTQGIYASVINHPWLNSVDTPWLSKLLSSVGALLTIDNHYLAGGQGETILATAAVAGLLQGKQVAQLGLTATPACGNPVEVLTHHGLDEVSITRSVRALLAQ